MKAKQSSCGCDCQSKFVDQANSITTLVMRFNELDKDIRALENEKSSKMSMIADDLLQLETRICRIEDDDILKRLSDLELMHIDVKDCMAGIMYQVQMRRDSAEITDPNERVNKWVKEKMENLYPDIFEINNEDKS